MITRFISGKTPKFLPGALLFVCVSLLASCASWQQPGESKPPPAVPLNPPVIKPGAGPTDSTGAIRHEIDSPRIAQLWSASEKARLANNLVEAERLIQEALLIAPEDSVLWSRAAEFKLTLLEPALAENYAGKSIAYAAENGTLLHRNWLIIEHARDMRGDLLGVRDAQKMVQRFQY